MKKKLFLITYMHKAGYRTSGNFEGETEEEAVKQAWKCDAIGIESVKEVK